MAGNPNKSSNNCLEHSDADEREEEREFGVGAKRMERVAALGRTKRIGSSRDWPPL
jgi:hypothetical protein